jgi:hypothetical protein
MARHTHKDPKTGRWARIPVELAYDADSKFAPTRSIDVNYADGKDSAYEMVPGDRNVVQRPQAPAVRDDLGVGGSPLRARRPEMVPQLEDRACDVYGVQGEVGRAAAKDAGDLDPTRWLTHGAE